MGSPRTIEFTYEDIAKVIDAGTQLAVRQHVSRGIVDPDDLESLAVYLARYGRPELREAILKSYLHHNRPDDPGGWQRKKVEG